MLGECGDLATSFRKKVVTTETAAQELTSELALYLGHRSLKFASHERGYKLIRNGKSVEEISDGEKSIVSLLHFLKTLNDKDVVPEKTIVIIDDPVTSLDDDRIETAYYYLRSKLERFEQVIILTHNFRLYRMLRDWCWENKKLYPYISFQLRAESCGDKRSAVLELTDPLLDKYDTEYHYLFGKVVEGALLVGDEQLEMLSGYPNCARKLLEAFLAFRYPSKSMSGGRLVDRWRMITYDKVKTGIVYKYINTYSHCGWSGNEELDLTGLRQTKSVMNLVLALMAHEDYSHTKEMLTLIGDLRGLHWFSRIP